MYVFDKILLKTLHSCSEKRFNQLLLNFLELEVLFMLLFIKYKPTKSNLHIFPRRLPLIKINQIKVRLNHACKSKSTQKKYHLK